MNLSIELTYGVLFFLCYSVALLIEALMNAGKSQMTIEEIQRAVFHDILGRVQFFKKPNKGILLGGDDDVCAELSKSQMQNFKRYSLGIDNEMDSLSLLNQEEGVDMLICAWIHSTDCMKKSVQLAKNLLKKGGWWLFSVVLEDGLFHDNDHLSQECVGLLGKEHGGLCSMQTVMKSIIDLRMLQPVIDCTRFNLGLKSKGELEKLISQITGEVQMEMHTEMKERHSCHIEIAFGTVFVKEKARRSMQEIIL